VGYSIWQKPLGGDNVRFSRSGTALGGRAAISGSGPLVAVDSRHRPRLALMAERHTG
jgi:hypothetical protein